MSNHFKGQRVINGTVVGTITGFCGRSVRVLVERERLVMAGTFPDKPIGTEKRLVTEFWHLSKIRVEGGAQ